MNTINKTLSYYRLLLSPIAKRAKRGRTTRYDTSDIVQESMLQIWVEMQKTDSVQFCANKTYLEKVGQGQACRQHRRHTAKKRSTNSEVVFTEQRCAGEDDPQLSAEKDELTLLVLQTMNQLADAQRLVVCRRFFDQNTFAEIAAEMQVSIDVVRHHYKRAIEQMKRLLQKLDSFHLPHHLDLE